MEERAAAGMGLTRGKASVHRLMVDVLKDCLSNPQCIPTGITCIGIKGLDKLHPTPFSLSSLHIHTTTLVK